VAITEVDPNSAAAENGLQAGDVILEVAGKAVSIPADVRKDIHDSRASGKHSVLMRVRSGDRTKFVALPISNG
jgi:serine protease Do